MVTTYQTDSPTAPVVYMTRDISPAGLMKAYEALGVKPQGKVAVKLSTGEGGNTHYLQPALIKDLVQRLDGTIVECNTAYAGTRNESSKHWETIKEHGFMEIAPVDLQDEEGEIEIYVVLSHFKGHVMGGFGGALKNISIGIASSHGKERIHSGQDEALPNAFDGDHDSFLEAMAEAATGVFNALHGNMLFINVMNNLSVDCDCDGNPHAPQMNDIGILASLDPVAVDQACVDQVYLSDDNNGPLIERMESRHAIHTVEHAVEMGLGNRNYRLVDLDA